MLNQLNRECVNESNEAGRPQFNSTTAVPVVLYISVKLNGIDQLSTARVQMVAMTFGHMTH
jgi:hypothetical protein